MLIPSLIGARGFTLVELLVVIGIIALLISILLPTLNRVRASAQNTVCLSNQRQLAAATHAYANDHGGAVMVYRPELPGRQSDRVNSPVQTYRAGYADPTEAATDVRPGNHGMLFDLGYADAADVFYCPAQRFEMWRVEEYPQPWLSEGTRGVDGATPSETGVWLVRSAYMLAPYVVPNPSLGREYRRYPRMVRFPADRALYMDLLLGHDFSAVSHDDGSKWNVATVDGSVRGFVDREMGQLLRDKRIIPARMNWGNFNVWRNRLLQQLPPDEQDAQGL